MGVVWICCSAGRPTMLKNKTLRMLATSGFIGTVFIIVPHEEVATYTVALADAPVSCVLQGTARGLVKQRAYARTLFPPGQEMVFIDDDISSIKMKVGKKFQKVGAIHNIVDYCFEWLACTESLMWGVYPVANSMFMKERIATGNCYVVGAFYGIVNDPRLEEPSVDECEDYSRQLSEQAAGRPPLRFDCFGIDTRYFKNPGGMQSDRKPEVRRSVVATLVDTYPAMVKSKSRKDGTPDLAFLKKPVYKPLLLTADHGTLTVQSTPAAAPASESAPHDLSGSPLPPTGHTHPE